MRLPLLPWDSFKKHLLITCWWKNPSAQGGAMKTDQMSDFSPRSWLSESSQLRADFFRYRAQPMRHHCSLTLRCSRTLRSEPLAHLSMRLKISALSFGILGTELRTTVTHSTRAKGSPPHSWAVIKVGHSAAPASPDSYTNLSHIQIPSS